MKFLDHVVPWSKTRSHAILGAVRHAMGERVVVPNKGIYDAEVFLEKSPELVGFSLSAHRLIKPDGTILVCVADDRVAYHAGDSKYGELVGLNRTFLGVEFLMPGEWIYSDFKQAMLNGSAKFTAEQYDAGGWQFAEWMQTYGFGYANIVDHSGVAGDDVRGPGQGKLDPGCGFVHGRLTDRIRHYLAAEQSA